MNIFRAISEQVSNIISRVSSDHIQQLSTYTVSVGLWSGITRSENIFTQKRNQVSILSSEKGYNANIFIGSRNS